MMVSVSRVGMEGDSNRIYSWNGRWQYLYLELEWEMIVFVSRIGMRDDGIRI